MNDLDLPKLDHDIARAARAERAWWRTLRTDAERAAADAWFEPVRHVTTRTMFAAFAELGAGHPLRDSFLRWVHRLALTRIGGSLFVEAERARQRPSIDLETPERGTFAPRQILQRALADRDPARARAWLEGLSTVGPAIASAEKRVREAEVEITARLGVSDRALLDAFDRETLRTEGEKLLARTDDLASSLLGAREDLAGLLPVLVASDVPGVWPRQPDARWLFEQFQGTPLIEGLTLDLGPTPRPLGAASFARALARFGAAYARAAVLGGGSFVLAADPSDAHPLRRGALFGALLGDPIFLRKKIGLSRDAAGGAGPGGGFSLVFFKK
jgi:hypothetical protein